MLMLSLSLPLHNIILRCLTRKQWVQQARLQIKIVVIVSIHAIGLSLQSVCTWCAHHSRYLLGKTIKCSSVCFCSFKAINLFLLLCIIARCLVRFSSLVLFQVFCCFGETIPKIHCLH